LDENIHQRQAELLRLQQEISEARATIESVNDDRQAIQEYKELKGGMNNLQLKEKISNVFRSFKIYGYDGKKIIEVLADIIKAKKHKIEI
jgi:hypothetical protein